MRRSIVDHVHRLPDVLRAPFAARMSQVKTSKTGPHVSPVPRERAMRLRRKLLNGVEQERLVSLPRIVAPSLGADRENVR